MGPESDNDPIVSSFDVLLNPSLPHGRKLWVLQQPNQTNLGQPPATEMRLKTSTGMVELDVPLDYMVSYDRDKGMHYGRHLKNSLAAKAGGTHGLSGGFGVGAPPPQRKKRGGDDRDDDLFLDWTEALRQDKVLRTQTLGGQLPDHKEVQYMIGVFQGKDLHLTPVSNLVHLRPQLHHVDAVAHQERLAASNAAKEAAGAAGAVGAPSAKAIHMTIKQGGDNNVATTETMLDRLNAVQKEDWRKLKFTDENDEAAWDVYQESLILGGKDAAKKEVGKADDEEEDEDMEGKGKEKAQDDDATAPEVDIAERVAKLSTAWGDDQLLEAVSGIVKPKVITKEEKRRLEEAAAAEAEQKTQAAAETGPKRTASRRGRGRGTAARGRGGTARGATAASAMDLTQ